MLGGGPPSEDPVPGTALGSGTFAPEVERASPSLTTTIGATL